MEEFVALAGIIGALAVGVVSPGPSFVMVARLAVATSRVNGLGAAVGMGVGGVVFAVAALFGLQAILLAVPSVYVVLKLLGGLYLCYLGFRIFLAAKVPLTVEVPGQSVGTPRSRSFWLGLTTQVSNPKTAIVYASVMLGTIGGERRSNGVDYRGEKIRLTKAYADYDDYKNDPENIHPSETERVQALVLGAPIARTFGSRPEATKAVGQIVFPGYGGGGFVEQAQADGTVLMGVFS